MVECLTQDRRAVGSSLTGVTALWSLSKHIYPSLVLVQPRKNRPYITERLLMGRKESKYLHWTIQQLQIYLNMDNAIDHWSRKHSWIYQETRAIALHWVLVYTQIWLVFGGVWSRSTLFKAETHNIWIFPSISTKMPILWNYLADILSPLYFLLYWSGLLFNMVVLQ